MTNSFISAPGRADESRSSASFRNALAATLCLLVGAPLPIYTGQLAFHQDLGRCCGVGKIILRKIRRRRGLDLITRRAGSCQGDMQPNFAADAAQVV